MNNMNVAAIWMLLSKLTIIINDVYCSCVYTYTTIGRYESHSEHLRPLNCPIIHYVLGQTETNRDV